MWKSTDEITGDPAHFVGKEIIIGSKYSLVSPSAKPDKLHDTLFQDYEVLETVFKNNAVHVLVGADSFQSADRLQSSFLVKGMSTLPDVYEGRICKTISYNITVKMPDGNTHRFSQLLPVQNT